MEEGRQLRDEEDWVVRKGLTPEELEQKGTFAAAFRRT
jgi:hypothetical protein